MIRHGWRIFVCECGEVWTEKSRDRFSPSGDNCETCSDWVTPFAGCESPATDVDSHGNLVQYERVVIRRGKG